MLLTRDHGYRCLFSGAAAAAAFVAADAIQGYTDNCAGAVTATLTNTSVTGDDCAWTVTYTFTVSDACGNDLVGQTYSNTGGDQTDPSIDTPASDQAVECDGAGNVAALNAWLRAMVVLWPVMYVTVLPGAMIML